MILYDGYYYDGSTGTKTDEYNYDQTYTDGYTEEVFSRTYYSVPLIIQFKGNRNYYQYNTGVIWLPGQNGYWQFRAGIAVGF